MEVLLETQKSFDKYDFSAKGSPTTKKGETMKKITLFVSILFLSFLANAAENGTYDCKLTTPNSPHDSSWSFELSTESAVFYDQDGSKGGSLTWDADALGTWIEDTTVGSGWLAKYKVERTATAFIVTYKNTSIEEDGDSPFVEVVTSTLTKLPNSEDYSLISLDQVINEDGSATETDKVTYTCSKK